jgi:hypothetical protein
LAKFVLRRPNGAQILAVLHRDAAPAPGGSQAPQQAQTARMQSSSTASSDEFHSLPGSGPGQRAAAIMETVGEAEPSATGAEEQAANIGTACGQPIVHVGVPRGMRSASSGVQEAAALQPPSHAQQAAQDVQQHAAPGGSGGTQARMLPPSGNAPAGVEFEGERFHTPQQELPAWRGE